GKQLLFMGCEFGQEAEWSEGRSLDWWLLDQPLHFRVHNLVKDLNRLYRDHEALWALDNDRAGFEWLEADDAAHNTVSWLRFGRGDRGTDAPVVACVMNFGGETQQTYRIGVPRGGRWTVVLDTAGYHPDAPSSTGVVLTARQESWHHQPYCLDITVPRFSSVWVVPVDEAVDDSVAEAVDESATAAIRTVTNAAVPPPVGHLSNSSSDAAGSADAGAANPKGAQS
ncbi:MAG: alpha amylase C-terminal domain-containing protein, partial [Terracoccus sp.]